MRDKIKEISDDKEVYVRTYVMPRKSASAWLRENRRKTTREIIKRARKRRRARQRARHIPRKVLLLFIALIAVVVLIGIFSVPIIGSMTIADVNVEGNNALTESEILQVTSFLNGEKIFSVKRREVVSAARSIPRVKSCNISYKLPGTVNISVEEYVPFARTVVNDSAFTLTPDLHVIDMRSSDPDIVIYLPPVKKCVAGQDLEFRDENNFTLVKRLLTELEKFDFSPDRLTTVNVTNVYDVNITLESGIAVYLGNTQKIGYKLALYKKAFESTNTDIKSIDVSDASFVFISQN